MGGLNSVIRLLISSLITELSVVRGLIFVIRLLVNSLITKMWPFVLVLTVVLPFYLEAVGGSLGLGGGAMEVQLIFFEFLADRPRICSTQPGGHCVLIS